MKSLTAAIALAVGLLLALWWSIQAPHYAPSQSSTVGQQRQAQCPGNSYLEGKACVCPAGTNWSGSACVQVWSSSAPQVIREQLPDEPLADNCVFFARKRVPTLPYNLNTWKGKLAAVNSDTPRAGSVAMIEIGAGKYKDVGHVAIVEAIGRDSLTIIEGNYLMGSVTRRTATGKDVADAARQLGIVGYYHPQARRSERSSGAGELVVTD